MEHARIIVVLACMALVGACATTSRTLPATDDSAQTPVETPAPEPEPTSPEAGEEPDELKNTLRWTTASEVENFGFDIYRATSEDGPFTRMTEEPLAGAGTVDEPQHYVWEDTTIEPGVDYYYYIESISYAGVRERFSPVIKSPAKN
jgi:hypothetical protein